MSHYSKAHPSILVEAMQHNWKKEKLADTLAADGHDEVSIDLLLREFKKLCIARRQRIGLVLIAVGVFLGLMSCLLTILNPFPELFNLILYGLTSAAIIVAFVGLYYIFE